MVDFTFRELECFVAVAEEGTFTKAAERLHLAQPPLSRHINNLEEKLEVTLFERSRRGAELTSAGEAFRRDTQEILPQVRRAADAALQADRGKMDRLEVGFVSAVLSEEMVGVFSRFRKKYPEVQLNLNDRLPVDQLDDLKKGGLDIGFVGIAPDHRQGEIQFRSWVTEDLMIFLPLDHPLQNSDTVSLEELREEPFLMVSSEAAPTFSAHVRRICQSAGFQPRVVQEARRAQAVAAMSLAGSGVAILPAALNRLVGNGVPIRSSGEGESQITYSVAHRGEVSDAASRFLECL